MSNTERSRQLLTAAQLRATLNENFSAEDLQLLCYDLRLDYDDLPGSSKATKIVSLLEVLGRTDRVVELIDRCAMLRPQVVWTELRAAALSNPAAFRPDALDSVVGKPTSFLNLPPDRALRLGFGLGILLVVVLLCGFSGGLVAGRFVNVTVNPVPADVAVGSAAVQELAALQRISRGDTVVLTYDNVKATSLANELLFTPDAPISDPHVQFLANDEITLNTRVAALGNRRVVVGMEANVINGRLVLQSKGAVLDVLGLQGTTFGWIPIPTSWTGQAMAWLQQRLDASATRFWFNEISVRPNWVQVILTKR